MRAALYWLCHGTGRVSSLRDANSINLTDARLYSHMDPSPPARLALWLVAINQLITLPHTPTRAVNPRYWCASLATHRFSATGITYRPARYRDPYGRSSEQALQFFRCYYDIGHHIVTHHLPKSWLLAASRQKNYSYEYTPIGNLLCYSKKKSSGRTLAHLL